MKSALPWIRNRTPRSVTCVPHNNRHFRSSGLHHFPVSDYDVFWLRQPRKWDFIEFGNHPQMHPGQFVPFQKAQVLFGRHVPQHKKRRLKSEDTFNRWWEVPPWEHDHPRYKVPCTLNTKNDGIIDFELDRTRIAFIDRDLRSRCTLYNLYIRYPSRTGLTPHQIIQESWKYYTKQGDDNPSNAVQPSNYYIDRYKANDALYQESTLTTKFVHHYQIFLKEIKKRMIFDDVESMHFEQYLPGQPMLITVPIRFYGLDQWFPINRDGFFQWKAPRKNDRPRYIQHEWEIEFEWNGTDLYKIPRHLSLTVEQFCLPWKTEITLADFKLPDHLKPMKDPSDIKILSLDFSKMNKKEESRQFEEEEEEIDLTKATF